jgi:uncharacterized protein YndB with AHSA1/START domain
MDYELNFALETSIQATPQRVWEALTEEMAEWWVSGQTESPMNLTLERIPGGRLFRDLDGAAGHFWAHVQVIKPPRLLELVGPMFTSLPITHHVTFRIEQDALGAVVKYHHRAFGPIPTEMREHISAGTETFVLKRLKNHVER